MSESHTFPWHTQNFIHQVMGVSVRFRHTILNCKYNYLLREQEVVAWSNNQNALFKAVFCFQGTDITKNMRLASFTYQTSKVIFSHIALWNQAFFGHFEAWKERDCFSPESQKNATGGSPSWIACFPEKAFLEKLNKAGLMQTLRGGGFPGLDYPPGGYSQGWGSPDRTDGQLNQLLKQSHLGETLWWGKGHGVVWGELRCRMAGLLRNSEFRAQGSGLSECAGMGLRGQRTPELQSKIEEGGVHVHPAWEKSPSLLSHPLRRDY